jgi:tRNA(Arg) A34 adenosine deaminase TadA
MNHETFMRRAIALSREGIADGSGGPIGAVIVRGGKIIGEGHNRVFETSDPTAHGEIVAIRDAAAREKAPSLPGAVIYTTCEPCPMCLAAIYWAELEHIYYANSKEASAAAGFDDTHLYREFSLDTVERAIPATQLLASEAKATLEAWKY